MVTLKDIAERCGVTTATVSNIINGKSKAGQETTQKVLDTVRELGYQPNVMARGLRASHTKTIGILVEDITHFNAPKIIVSIMNNCALAGYQCIIENMRFYMRQGMGWSDEARLEYKHDVMDTLSRMKSMKVDGLIYIACHARVIDILPEDAGFPIVMAYSYVKSETIPAYVPDDSDCSYDVIKRLYDLGHRKIGIIAGANNNLHSETRVKSYQKAMFDFGLPYDPDMIYSGEWDRATGKKGAEFLLEHGATAIYCFNDEMAGGAYDCARERGLVVGKDISIVGHDDREIAAFLEPGLSTIEIPLYDIGYRSARRVIEIIEGRSEAKATVSIVPCRFVERQSIGCKS